jgi:dTMP kinase
VGGLTGRGRFVALEGVDGAGKTTQLALLADALRARGHDVVTTREPGGTALGERLRGVLLGQGGPPPAPVAEVLLFAAARAQLVAEVIRPALDAGRFVVCDRFVDSSLAYQGAARGVGIDAVWRANEAAVDDCLPDRSVVLDLDAGRAAERRDGDADRIEGEGADFQARVAEGYRELARRFPGRVVVVPAAGTPGDVHAAVMSALAGVA